MLGISFGEERLHCSQGTSQGRQEDGDNTWQMQEEKCLIMFYSTLLKLMKIQLEENVAENKKVNKDNEERMQKMEVRQEKRMFSLENRMGNIEKKLNAGDKGREGSEGRTKGKGEKSWVDRMKNPARR